MNGQDLKRGRLTILHMSCWLAGLAIQTTLGQVRWLLGSLVDWLVGWLVDRLVSWLVGWLAGWVTGCG